MVVLAELWYQVLHEDAQLMISIMSTSRLCTILKHQIIIPTQTVQQHESLNTNSMKGTCKITENIMGKNVFMH